MSRVRERSMVTGSRLTALIAAGALALGLSAGVTSAAWVDDVSLGAAAAGGTFDIQARFASEPDLGAVGGVRSISSEEWQDVGLPGDPDTFDDGFEIVIPPITDALPAHSYVGDVFLCNAGDLDGRVSAATLDEVTTDRTGQLITDTRLIEPGSIEVENIDIGTIIPANSCEDSSVEDPEFDVEGIIHFTTNADFIGQYGSTSRLVIKIWVTSLP